MASRNGHEERRLATREALRKAALSRFQRDGFDETAIADIAADAGVSERTFYRHFPTKEAALFQDYDDRVEWLSRALSVRPRTESIFDAVLAATASYPDDAEVVRQTALLRASLISREAADVFMRKVQAAFAEAITNHAALLLEGLPNADLLARVTGASIAAALVAAVDVWGQRGAEDDLGEMVANAVAFLRNGLVVSEAVSAS
jgi:AcrR family transcriptional regulator